MDPEPPSGPTSSITSPKKQITAQPSIRDETINSHPSSDVASSPVSDNAHDSITQSPPVQIMERHEDFDISNRYSSSSGWSSVSGDSLFSIHTTNSCRHDQAHLAEHSGQDDVGNLKAGRSSKLDDHVSDLDEPQKVVRWKTQVEHIAGEGVSSQRQQPDSSSSTDHKSSEPKNKPWWSICDCRSCNLPKWSCWKGCWKYMTCSNCRPKKTSSSHSEEANATMSSEPQKKDSEKGCCCNSCFNCSKCTCYCCLGEIAV